MNKQTFSYWRHRWGPWLCTASAVLSGASLLMSRSEYRELTEVGPRIFSPEALDAALCVTRTQMLLMGVVLALMLGALLTGALARSKKAVLGCETLLLGLIGAGLGLLLLAAPERFEPIGVGVLMAASAGGALFDLVKLLRLGREE